MLMNVSLFRDVHYVETLRAAKLKVNENSFIKLEELDDNIFVVESRKKTVKHDLPIQIGWMILGYAKLRLLSFYYDFLDVYVSRDDFVLSQCDTDSLYFAISKPTLAEVIKPEMLASYHEQLLQRCDDVERVVDDTYWLPRECCPKHKNHDRRTPGLWKLEASGSSIRALNSKTYLLDQGDTCKMSCKGVSKSRVENPKHVFASVLETHEPQNHHECGI